MIAELESPATRGYFEQPRHEISRLVPASAERILDVGCADGVLGAALLARGASEVIGVELDEGAASRARRRLTRVVCADAESPELPAMLGAFDCVVFADVLEHMRDPQAALARYRACLRPDGVVVASIPNVRHCSILNMLAEGRWEYQAQGIMDRTHLRFFTLAEITRLFEGAGLKPTLAGATMDPRFEEVRKRCAGAGRLDLTFGRLTLRELAPAEVQELFVVQYLLVGEGASRPAQVPRPKADS